MPPTPRTPLRLALAALVLLASQLAGARMGDALLDTHAHAAAGASVRVAITFDDLPLSGETLPEWPAERVVRSILETLRRHRVRAAVGFFTGSNSDGAPGTLAALREWCDDGHLLANHSYAHIGADVSEPARFLEDARDNQAALLRIVPADCTTPRYFRYPGLVRGRGGDGQAIHGDLTRAGFTVADASLDNADWAFTDAFARCRRSGDARAERAVVDTYLEHATAELAWSVDTALRLWGRPIPHVLLLHANALTAELLDALLTRYEAANVVFVPLQEALADPAYVEREASAPTDGKLLESTLRRRGLAALRFVPEPLALIDALCPDGAAP